MEHQQHEPKTEKYQGPGKLWSAIGGLAIGSVVGRIAAIPFVVAAGNAVERAESSGRGIRGMFAYAGMAGVIRIGSEIAGTVIGWKLGAKGKRQFEESQQKLDAGAQTTAIMAVEVANLKQQRDMYKLGLETATVREHPKPHHQNAHEQSGHTTFVDKVGGHHDSKTHAEAVLVDKAQAAEAVAAR